MAHVQKKRKYEREFCPHCNKEVSKSTWYLHYNQFFNQATGLWKRDTGGDEIRHIHPSFKFSPSSTESSDDNSVDEFCFEQFSDMDNEPPPIVRSHPVVMRIHVIMFKCSTLY